MVIFHGPETGKGVDGGAWGGMMAERKLIYGVSDEAIDFSFTDAVSYVCSHPSLLQWV